LYWYGKGADMGHLDSMGNYAFLVIRNKMEGYYNKSGIYLRKCLDKNRWWSLCTNSLAAFVGSLGPDVTIKLTKLTCREMIKLFNDNAIDLVTRPYIRQAEIEYKNSNMNQAVFHTAYAYTFGNPFANLLKRQRSCSQKSKIHGKIEKTRQFQFKARFAKHTVHTRFFHSFQESLRLSS
jgi:hypothetical protein